MVPDVKKMTPSWLKPFKYLWILNHRLRRLRAGHFKLKSTSYEIYTKKSPAKRVEFFVQNPTPIWWTRI